MNRCEEAKIRILEFELFYKTGGIETFLLNLYSKINRNRYEFHLVSSYEHPENEDSFEALGGIVYKIEHPRRFFRYIKSINELMKNHRFDIVHMNKCSAINIFPVLIARKNHIPVILHSHNSMTRLGKIAIPIQLINRRIISKMSISHLACSEAAGSWMYGSGKYKIIRNGIDVQKFVFSSSNRIEMREQLGISKDTKVFTNLGDLRKQKNPIFLIELFSEMVKIENCKLLIIGDGILKNEMENIAKREGILDRIIFLGKRNDVPKLLSCVDGLIMPSLFEGLSMACVESQANGLRLFLSEGISRETQLTNHVYWFSLDDNKKNIASMIVNTSRENLSAKERMMDNSVVKDKGFDILNTARAMEDVFEKALEGKG